MSDKKILVVDDEAAIRSLLRSAVASVGAQVFEAEDGRHALTIANAQAPFELVITDVLMPEMDGIDMAKCLMQAGQAERFLFISGYCDLDASPERIQDFGMAAFLAKPFSIPELLGRVGELMQRKRRPALKQKRSGSGSA